MLPNSIREGMLERLLAQCVALKPDDSHEWAIQLNYPAESGSKWNAAFFDGPLTGEWVQSAPMDTQVEAAAWLLGYLNELLGNTTEFAPSNPATETLQEGEKMENDRVKVGGEAGVASVALADGLRVRCAGWNGPEGAFRQVPSKRGGMTISGWVVDWDDEESEGDAKHQEHWLDLIKSRQLIVVAPEFATPNPSTQTTNTVEEDPTEIAAEIQALESNIRSIQAESDRYAKSRSETPSGVQVWEGEVELEENHDYCDEKHSPLGCWEAIVEDFELRAQGIDPTKPVKLRLSQPSVSTVEEEGRDST